MSKISRELRIGVGRMSRATRVARGERAIARLPSIESAVVNLADQTAAVRFLQAEIPQRIEEERRAGYFLATQITSEESKMPKAIICIHGRSNKPEAGTLRKWWKISIEEGLSESTRSSLGSVDFEMAYYADIHYADGPIPDSENEEPYQKAKKGAIQSYESGIVDRIREISGGWLDTPLDWLEENSNLFSSLGRAVSKKLLKDLGEYYSNNDIRRKVNDRLRSLLLEYQQDEIILISHSMGTIVAYEVLRDLGRSRDFPGFTIGHFITMGSPLGLTVVKGNMVDVHRKLRTPSCVRGSWVNLSDPQDFVCLDSHLRDDYTQNSSSVRVKDMMVCNDYPGNEHKSYGYLRTPEFSTHLASLL